MSKAEQSACTQGYVDALYGKSGTGLCFHSMQEAMAYLKGQIMAKAEKPTKH